MVIGVIGVTLLGKSVAFEMKDGSTVLLKVQVVDFTNQVFKGMDDEGMNTVIDFDQIATYIIPGSGVKV